MRAILLAALTLAGCTPYSETVGGAAPVGTVWVLQALNDQPFTEMATLTFQASGKVAGSGPCNRFSARQTAPLPWFEITDIEMSRRSCDGLAAEQRFLTALEAMDFSEIGGDRMLLSNADGQTMLFGVQADAAGT